MSERQSQTEMWVKDTLKIPICKLISGYYQIKKQFHPKVSNKFLFILSPPYCGSTLLNQIISTSHQVSVNNPFGVREGQQLYSVKDMMFNHDRRWDPDFDFDWEYIKGEWLKHWDQTKPILLEKSPPNIIRAESIKAHFDPAYFIIFFRNPYAHCESLMRRQRKLPDNAAKFAIRYLKHQKRNIEQLDNSLKISYEQLTGKPEETIKEIEAFLPELNDLDVDQKFSAHNYQGKALEVSNLNTAKIAKLSKEAIQEINEIFKPEQELIAYFGYSIMEPGNGKQ